MNKSVAILFFPLLLFCLTGRTETGNPGLQTEKPDIRIFGFYYISEARKGILINTGKVPLKGELQLTGALLSEEITERPNRKLTVWSQKIDLPAGSGKVILLPMEVCQPFYRGFIGAVALEFHAADGIFYTYPNDKYSYSEWFIIMDGPSGAALAEKLREKYSNDLIRILPEMIPVDAREFFFARLMIGVNELNNLDDRQYDALKSFILNGGFVMLIDNAAGSPGPRLAELTGIVPGTKKERLSPDIIEAVTASIPSDPEAFPLIREFTAGSGLHKYTGPFPFYQRSYGLGKTAYIPYDIGQPVFLRQINEKAFSYLIFMMSYYSNNMFEYDRYRFLKVRNESTRKIIWRKSRRSSPVTR